MSGVPRSGTSLVMQMLEAGGVPLLADGQRAPDQSNPRGYYEYAPVKRLYRGEAGWLKDARGRVVKVVSPLLSHLPVQYEYRVIFIERDLEEVLRSQQSMRLRNGEPGFEMDAMRAELDRHLVQIREWLAAQPNMDVRYVSHRELMRDPRSELQTILEFLPPNSDLSAMCAVVDPALYRQRSDTD